MKTKPFNSKYLSTGFLHFYVHFVTEVACFFVLTSYTKSAPIAWLLTLTYDMLAFVPQGVVGYFNDKFKKINLGIFGLVFLAVALILQHCTPWTFLPIVILCIGNAFTHVNGAQATLRTSNGSLSHSAIFVAGGSFGVVTGQLLGQASAPYWMILFAVVSAIPFTILAQMYMKKACSQNPVPCKSFNYNNPKISKYLIVFLAVVVVIVRGYMAYGIPISWKKTTLQTILLFVFMGIGKALGGVFADLFGVKRIAILSVLLALPFLLFGDNNMFISLIGVLLFSMTMSVTLALIVSALPKTPGLAFGFTTIGLFMGTIPVFFFKITDVKINCIMLSVLTVVCLLSLIVSIRKDETNE